MASLFIGSTVLAQDTSSSALLEEETLQTETPSPTEEKETTSIPTPTATSESAGEPPIGHKPQSVSVVHDSEEASDETSHWYDAIDFQAFVDAYARLDWNFPKPQTETGMNRGYDFSNGFSFAWVGLDLSYDSGPVGGSIQLRFGPSVPRLLGGDAVSFSFDNVKQAFVSWRPFESLQLDFGQFDTVYGIEVADSQYNMNYTRGTLYFVGQPFYHSGLRARLSLSEMFSLTGLVVNGWNNTIDNNIGKTYGIQLNFDLQDTLHAALGYLGGPEQADTDDAGAKIPNANEQWRHFVDVLASIHASEKLSLDVNADLGAEDIGSSYAFWWGVMVGARYSFVDSFALALRGEYFSDKDAFLLGVADLDLITGTLTLDYQPSKHLIIRLDNRVDMASNNIYPRGTNQLEQLSVSSVLGLVAMVGN
ncbi:MAG: porin [Myxococcales bacterium]|nr:MAG: porin [Myxococcales bacterium]